MSSKKPSFIRIKFNRPSVAFAVLIALAGCARTSLSPNRYNFAQHALMARASLTPLCAEIGEVPESLGHQYGLVFMPLGIVEGGDTAKTRIVEELSSQAALQGVRIDTTCDRPSVKFLIEELSVSAHDYIFVRRVSALVKISIISSERQKIQQLEGNSASWRRFGYRAQLDLALHEALQSAIRNVTFEKFLSLR